MSENFSGRVFPWKHWCMPYAGKPQYWVSELDLCPQCGKAAPLFPRIDEDYLDAKREELRDEYRTSLDSPPE
jgi:hypothetical protein